MPILKNSRHEKFVQALVKGISQVDAAIEAGYSPKWARSFASYLSTNLNIIERREELSKLAETDTIMTVIERKERLSELSRARLVDFIDAQGNITLEAPNNAALQEVVVTEWQGGNDESLSSRKTRVKLHNPIASIAELNKMEHIYEERVPPGTTIVNTFMFILPGGQKVSPKQLREVNPIEGQAIEHIEVEGENQENNLT